MKKTLFFAFIMFAVFSLVSFAGGFGSGTGQAATTAPGETGATCGQGGCHASGAFNPSLDVFLIDNDGNQIEKYLPGETYTVSLKINHSGLPNGYGFQMVCLSETDDNPINSFSDFPTNVGEVTLLGRQYIEQFRRLPVDSISMSWTAPEKETGSVIFYAVGNAVDGNGGPQNDGAATGNFLFEEDIQSSTENLTIQNLGLYPNPASELIMIPENIKVDNYQVHDLVGSVIAQGNNNSVDLNSIAKNGAYLIKVRDEDGQVYVDRFLKI